MKHIIRVLAMVTALILSPASHAVVTVDSMNFPAWVERDVRVEPLAPGDELLAGDIVNTGTIGRLWLEAEDGSVIKLGNSTRFVIDRARIDMAGDETFFDAAFNVLRGAFRFTGNFFQRQREIPHRVDMKVGAVTVGIRGTDIWGRSGENDDFVALLEGRIEARSDGDRPQIMDQPLTLYRKQKGLPADGVTTVSMSVVQQLAPETELSADAGIVTSNGPYSVVLGSVRSGAFVNASLDRFRRAGYPAEAAVAEVDGVSYTRTVLHGLVDLQAARNLRRTVAAEFAIDDVWILRAN